jgi:integrase
MVGTKGHKVIQNIPSREILDKLRSVAKTLEDKILVLGLLFTGFRVGELVHMRKNWIKWELNSIHIPYEQPCTCRHCRKARYRKNKKTGEWKLFKPANTWYAKTESAMRGFPIAPELKPVLIEFFSKYESVMDVYPYRELAWHRLKQLVKGAGIKWRVFPHLLRGCVASKLASQDVNVYRLKELMGWKTIDMAAEYVKLFRPPGKEEVVKW